MWKRDGGNGERKISDKLNLGCCWLIGFMIMQPFSPIENNYVDNFYNFKIGEKLKISGNL